MIDEEAILKERGQRCEKCRRFKKPYELDPHHTFIGRKRGQDWRDVPMNILMLCRPCHDKAHNREFREWAWKIQSARYGSERLADWYDNVPLRTKERRPG